MNTYRINWYRWMYLKELMSIRSLVIISPIFFLAIRGWTNLVVLIVFIASLFFLFKKVDSQKTSITNLWRWIISLTLVGPMFAVGMGQMLRGEIYMPNFDAPLRIALCAPVFLAISLGWLSREGKEPITFIWMKYSFPLAILWTFVYTPSWKTNWQTHGITTYFVDVLSFGHLTLLFAILNFAALTFFWSRIGRISRMVSFVSVLVGFYLSVNSGSRTGWLNVPIFLIIWATMFSVPIFGRVKTLLILFLMLAGIGIIIYTSPKFTGKVIDAINEISTYHWYSKSTEGSADIRISFYRMAFFYFVNNPFRGWGDLGWMELMNSPEIVQYASEYARNFPVNGFHNEILTSAVRSGVWGLASSVSLFLFPMLWAIKAVKSNTNIDARIIGFFVVFLMIHLTIAGMTTEVTNLIFLASFVGLSISVIVGEGVNQAAKLCSVTNQ